MEGRIKKWKNTRNVLKFLQNRETNAELGKTAKQYFQFTDSLIKRLGLEAELEGHQGCVNCLQWTADGRHLASGSDDTRIIYWDPFRHKQLQAIPTPHIGNIFSVKFLGASEDIIATGAGDSRVIVQPVEYALARNPPLLDCSCHAGRVKRLATAPDQPMLFWSAAEDGLVIQYDMREPHECSSRSKVFLDLSYTSEMKCIAVNPTKPHLIAIGANDCFVRLYDRRKVKTTSVSPNHTFDQRQRTPPTEPIDPNCVQYYSPGHLARENSKVMTFKLATTFIAFNSSGTEMLVNMGCEQIYLFDIHNTRHINELKIPQCLPKKRSHPYRPCCEAMCLSGINGLNVNSELPTNNKDFCACDYLRRAKKLLDRKWMGDIYAAARDYLYVIQFWPNVKQAYIGLLNCLISLKWKQEAHIWLEYYVKIFPVYKHSSQVLALNSEIEELTSTPREDNDGIDTVIKLVSEDEQKLRLDSYDYEIRFLGHCNATTDIKEANFLGDDGSYICAGSDDGIIFIWERKSTEIVSALWGDCSIVNCVQPHPNTCLIASSGIEPAVKIWSPIQQDDLKNSRRVCDISKVVEDNQAKLAMDPFETILANMSYRLGQGPFEGLSFDVASCRAS